MERYKPVDHESPRYSPTQRRQASKMQAAAAYDTETKLPPIRLNNANATIKELAASMLGHR